MSARPNKTKNTLITIRQWQENFQCAGDKCKDSCCGDGWTIGIDKNTYKAYRKFNDASLKDKVRKYIKIPETNGQSKFYSRISLLPDGNCPFLENGLCEIQLKMGEDLLSNTCFSYPRIYHKHNDSIRQHLTLSCPEVAKLALLGETHTHTTLKKQIRVNDATEFSTDNPQFLDWVLQLNDGFYDFILRDNYPTWFRLLIAGLYIEKIHDQKEKFKHYKTEENVLFISHMKSELNDISTEKQFEPLLGDFVANDSVSAVVFGKFHELVLPHLGGLSTFKEIDERIEKNILAMENDPGALGFDQLAALYRSGLSILKKNDLFEKIMRNYVAHTIDKNILATHFKKQFLTIVANYCFVRFLLALQARDGISNEEQTDNMISTIQVFTKGYDHNVKIKQSIITILTTLGFDKLEKMNLLLIE